MGNFMHIKWKIHKAINLVTEHIIDIIIVKKGLPWLSSG